MTDEQIFDLAETHGWQDDFGRWNFTDDDLLDFVHELRQALAQPANSTTAFVEPKASSQTRQEALGGEWVPCVKLPVIVHVRNQRDGETHISTREGITPVLPEDLIMRGVAGEEYPIGRELFERTYTFDVDAVNMSQERVDETAKGEHEYVLDCPRCGHCCPERKWVGLTHEERDEIDQNCKSQMQTIFATEATLKEKNT